MRYTPPRRLGLLLGGLFLILLVVGVLLSTFRLARFEVSAAFLVWVSLLLAGMPLTLLVAERLYGLLTVRYTMDRDGFTLRWGFNHVQLPLKAIQTVRIGSELPSALHPGLNLRWPGCVVGSREVAGLGPVEFYATTGIPGTALLSLAHGHLAISPPDAAAFQRDFLELARLGSLEQLPETFRRPDFLFARLWADRWARALILVGLGMPLLLLGFLTLRAPRLPSLVPFGFDTQGVPDTSVPPGRLLLLPLLGGIAWLVDFLMGCALFRQQSRVPAYVVWSLAILVGGLLWGAVLQILRLAAS